MVCVTYLPYSGDVNSDGGIDLQGEAGKGHLSESPSVEWCSKVLLYANFTVSRLITIFSFNVTFVCAGSCNGMFVSAVSNLSSLHLKVWGVGGWVYVSFRTVRGYEGLFSE